MYQKYLWICKLFLVLSMIYGVSNVQAGEPNTTEKECQDGIDNDGDTVYDCADADCASQSVCKPDGKPENTNKRCHDWIDNDQDGAIDCEDEQCQTELITACMGSWDLKIKGNSKSKAKKTTSSTPSISSEQDTVDLIGTLGDRDGERNDYLCSDGIDNDQDGKIDCEDLGCKFDESVQVCRGAPKMRFSIVGQIKHGYDFQAKDRNEPANSTRFSRLQLRSFGPIPQIQNSFYLISLLTERTPRLTFAMFSIPIGKTRHMFTINSGAAGLSQVQALSIHKQLLVDRTRIFRAFEAFNAAGLEVSGPLNADNTLNYRFFAAGGSGRYDGNIGGRTVNEEDINYPWSSGLQLTLNLKGYYSRFDTPFLYTPVPLTIAILGGVKYDLREREHFASSNVHFALRFKRLVTMIEHYYKKEFAFESQQASYHAQVGFLLWPKHIMIAADYGQYEAEPFKNAPDRYSNLIREPKDEKQYRAAAHWYFYRQVGIFSLVYNYRKVEEGQRDIDEDDNYRDLIDQKLELVAQFRF